MDSPVEFNKKLPPLTLGFIVTLLVFVGIGSWTIRGIYERFTHLEHENKVLNERIEYVNDRIDRKAEAVKEEVDDTKELLFQKFSDLSDKLKEQNHE